MKPYGIKKFKKRKRKQVQLSMWINATYAYFEWDMGFSAWFQTFLNNFGKRSSGDEKVKSLMENFIFLCS